MIFSALFPHPYVGCVFFKSESWHVSMPRNIEAMLGSCVVIPCTFDYYRYPPRRPGRIVWYQYVRHGYPVVYDGWNPNEVIRIFRGKTSLASSQYGKTCSLEIYPVTWSHHRQTIYPWVDPENVGRSTYRFFDTTVTIDVEGILSVYILITIDLSISLFLRVFIYSTVFF